MMQLKSHVTDIDWLPITNPAGATQLALLYQFKQSEWLTEMQLKSLQFQQLYHLLTHARKSVPYYQKGLQSLPTELHPLALENLWQEIPVLTRSQLLENTEQLVSQSVPEEHGKTSWIHTSGSSGIPVKVLTDELLTLYWKAILLRDHHWHNRDLRCKLAIIRYFEDSEFAQLPHGQSLPDWGAITQLMYKNGPACALSIHSPIKEQANWLMKENPDYLLTYPTNLHALVCYFQAEGIQLPGLKQIQTISEILDDETRSLCQKVFSVPVINAYSTRETGYIALQCPEHEHYHIQSEVVLVEVLNEQGISCAPGEIGRVVITPLHNFAMPLIRYEIGDYAEVGDTCPCGRGLPVIRRILGRTRNMLTLPTGGKICPRLDILKYTEITGVNIRQAQLMQQAIDKIEMRLVSDETLTLDQEQKLRQFIQKTLGHPYHMTLTYHQQLPRNQAGKFEEFISAIESD